MSDSANGNVAVGIAADAAVPVDVIDSSTNRQSASVGSSSISPQSRIQNTDSLLTDSENTNNENRIIEMESDAAAAAAAAVAADVAAAAAVAADAAAADAVATDAAATAAGAVDATVPTAVVAAAKVIGSDEVMEEPGDQSKPEPEKEDASEKSEDSDKVPDQDKYAEHVTYNEQGEAIYTDPETKFQYSWSKEKNEWVPVSKSEDSEADKSNPYENEHYRWCHETSKWIPKEDPKETEHYRWCDETKNWLPKVQPSEEDRTYSYVDGVHHYTDKDGAIYFWEEERRAWFPKVDDDFMAVYQLNYGFIDNTSGPAAPSVPSCSIVSVREEVSVEPEEEPQVQGKKRKAPPEPPKWFELKPEHNTKVYVSNLPLDMTEAEFAELMAKCGMVLKDSKTNKLKLKLYRDADGTLKGDGLCHYIKIESVDLALSILDNYDIRGHKIRVQQAEFQLKGEYNPSLKPKVKKKDKEKQRKAQEALFDWRPEKMRGERSKHERIVIIKNLFEPELFNREVQLLLEYQNDLREECNKCGTCRRVVLFDRHVDGVAQVTMSDPEEADLVVKLMHGRFFGKRKLTAAIWDGRTKYRSAETEADINARLDKWEEYLEKEEAAEDAKKLAEQTDNQSTKPAKDSSTLQEEKPQVQDVPVDEKPHEEAIAKPEIEKKQHPKVEDSDDGGEPGQKQEKKLQALDDPVEEKLQEEAIEESKIRKKQSPKAEDGDDDDDAHIAAAHDSGDKTKEVPVEEEAI